MSPNPSFAAIEAGGTKWRIAVGTGDKQSSRIEIETREPDETLEEVLAFIEREVKLQGPLAGLGIGSFGPLGICLLYTSPSPRDRQKSRMPSSA